MYDEGRIRIEFSKIHTLNNFSLPSLLFKYLYNLLVSSEVLNWNVDVYKTKVT